MIKNKPDSILSPLLFVLPFILIMQASGKNNGNGSSSTAYDLTATINHNAFTDKLDADQRKTLNHDRCSFHF